MKREYPEQPIVGVGAIILGNSERGPEIVLVQRGNEPLRGEWTIPGGALEVGEALQDGARREAREETGLEIALTDAVEIFDRIIFDDQRRVRFHYVLLDYICVPLAGELRCGGDAVDARWFRAEELDREGVSEFTASVAQRAIERFLRERLWERAQRTN